MAIGDSSSSPGLSPEQRENIAYDSGVRRGFSVGREYQLTLNIISNTLDYLDLSFETLNQAQLISASSSIGVFIHIASDYQKNYCAFDKTPLENIKLRAEQIMSKIDSSLEKKSKSP